MSDQTTTSGKTSEGGREFIGQPFRTPVSKEPVSVPEPATVTKPESVVIGVTAKTKADPSVKDVLSEKGSVANQYFGFDTPFSYLRALELNHDSRCCHRIDPGHCT